jgi:hypothetical protein
MKAYVIKDRQGIIIDRFTTLEEAEKRFKKYIAEDKQFGMYEPNYYEIHDSREEG